MIDPIAARPEKQPTVLVIDDDLDLRLAVRSALSATGWIVTEATTGSQALLLAQCDVPDVVVLDLGLPDMDGREVLARLRSMDETAIVPVLVLSASHSDAAVAELLQAGAQDYVAKPFSPTELETRLSSVCRNATARRDLSSEEEYWRTTSREKSAFLANMSHEIRTPMNAVIGMTGLLLDTPLDEVQTEYVEVVRHSSETLLCIINDILDFSKIEAGGLVLEHRPFDLRDCVEDALDLGAATDRNGLDLLGHVGAECPVTVLGDAARLRQVLVNLVTNAVKFTERGTVVVRVEPYNAGADDAAWRFSVTDTGIGIPADRLGSVFDSFSQVDNTTARLYGGTGLGLAISKQLVTAMGGTLLVESVEGQGSTFSFSIRLGTSMEALAAERPEVGTVLSGGRALVVAASDTSRTILRGQLEGWGMRVTEARSERAASILVTSGAPFDVALVDMTVPAPTGEIVRPAFRAELAGSAFPVILLRGRGDREAAPPSEAFFAVVTKPARSARLKAILIDALSPGRSVGRLTASRDQTEVQTPMRVLLVEDNPVNQLVGRRMLESLGHRVDVAGNGLEAIDAVCLVSYDAVFMDVQMPEMDGLDATRVIRASRPAVRQPYVIGLTANALVEDAGICADAGMDNYVAKPARISDYEDALERARAYTHQQSLVDSGGGPVISGRESGAPIRSTALAAVRGATKLGEATAFLLQPVFAPPASRVPTPLVTDPPPGENDLWAQEASRAFLESAPDAVVVIDIDGRIILVNAQTEAMFGYAREELVSQAVEILLPERFRTNHTRQRAGYVNEPRTRAMGAGMELFGRRANGSEFPIDISLSPLSTGGPTLFAAAVRDVTDRQRAAAKFGSFLESAPDAVVVIDADGRIALVNAQTERLFGHRRDEMVGQRVEMLLPERFRDSHIGRRAGYVDEPRTRAMGAGLSLYGQRADGTEFPIDISLAPLETEDGTLFAATVRDVTGRKRLESARDEFIHHAAHELRTPLATLAALGETLALHLDEMSAENVADALGALRRQGERASTLVANLLDLSQLESGHGDVRLEHVELSGAIARALEGAPAPVGTIVMTELNSDVAVVADPVQLERVFTNLLSNAYRYGGNRVHLSAEEVGVDVVVTITDDGGGVPSEIVDNVFDPFVRGRTAGNVGGSGVGLALCRRIVEAFGGAIWIDGEHPGATFKVRLPASQ